MNGSSHLLPRPCAGRPVRRQSIDEILEPAAATDPTGPKEEVQAPEGRPSAAAQPFFGEPEARRRAVRNGAMTFIVLRIALTVVSLVALGLVPPNDPMGVPGHAAKATTPGFHNLWDAWERMDALWYLRIAEAGYQPDDGSAAFFPLYPLLVKAVSFLLLGNELVAALLVSNACLCAALMLFHLWMDEEFGSKLASRATLYLAIFPSALIFMAPYAESLFLLLAIATLRAARQGRWPAAGGLGALAALTRSLGILLAASIATEAIQRYPLRRPNLLPLARGLAWAVVPAVGTLAFLGYWRWRGEDPLLPMSAQGQWGREWVFPWETVLKATRQAWDSVGTFPTSLFFLDWLLFAPMFAAAVMTVFRLRPAWTVYVWANLLVALSIAWPARPLMSMPRFLVVLFPLFVMVAFWTGDRPWAHRATLATSALLLGVTTLLFVNWYFVF